MEIGLGSVLNMLIILGILGTTLISYESDKATEQKSIALLEQRFQDFDEAATAQLATITAATASMPVVNNEITGMQGSIHTLDGRMDGLEKRVGVIEQDQAGTDAEIDGIVRASNLPMPEKHR